MRLLVANRAEIAVRIMATAAVLGIETVAVYPDDDAACAHVARAGAAVRLPGAGPAAYLDAGAIVGAATGVRVRHPAPRLRLPGREQRGFARRLRRGRSAVRRARPGGAGPVRRQDRGAGAGRPRGPGAGRATAAAADPGGGAGRSWTASAAGGGGDGEGGRRGRGPGHAAGDGPGRPGRGLRRSRLGGRGAFGDGAVYVEELLTRARHVEVQLIGDGTARSSQLGDRDCSLQRRRQKLIEIAPASACPGTLRARTGRGGTGSSARRRTPGWPRSSSWSPADRLVVRFIEVNPRIQVEHTVTEEVTGRCDLVEADPAADRRRRRPWRGPRADGQADAPRRPARGPGLRHPGPGQHSRPCGPTARAPGQRGPDPVRAPGRAAASGSTPTATRVRDQPALRLAAGQGDRDRRRPPLGRKPACAGPWTNSGSRAYRATWIC